MLRIYGPEFKGVGSSLHRLFGMLKTQPQQRRDGNKRPALLSAGFGSLKTGSKKLRSHLNSEVRLVFVGPSILHGLWGRIGILRAGFQPALVGLFTGDPGGLPTRRRLKPAPHFHRIPVPGKNKWH